MKQGIVAAGLAALIISTGSAWAGEQTVTLAVDNLFCASCPYIVKQTLAQVPGVRAVQVSFDKKTAVVSFEDTQTGVAALTQATANMGFPSRLLEQGG